MLPSAITTLFRGSAAPLEHPQLRPLPYAQDFGPGFYCTESRDEARRRALCFNSGCISVYRFQPSADLRVLRFDSITSDWLGFIAACRASLHHDYDIVEGPMIDASIAYFVHAALAGDLPRSVVLALAATRHPAHQISFHSEKALAALTFLSCEPVT